MGQAILGMSWPQWNRNCRIASVISIGVSLVLVVFGILYLQRVSFFHHAKRVKAKALKAIKEREAEVHVDCYQIARTMDEFWGCLVEGIDKYYLPPENERNLTSAEYGYQVFYKRKEVKVKNKTTENRKKRDASDTQVPYKPWSDKYIIKFVPVTTNSFSRFGTNDPFFIQRPYLYKHLGAGDALQRNPPWSYHGDKGPKQWHTLEIEKFLVPFRKDLSVEQASLSDHFFEGVWTDHDVPLYRAIQWFWKRPLPLSFLYPEPDKPGEIQTDVDPNIVKHWTLVSNPPNAGYYSFMRFLLPPPSYKNSDPKEVRKEIEEYKKLGILKSDFVIPPGASYPAFNNYLDTLQRLIETYPDIAKEEEPVYIDFLYNGFNYIKDFFKEPQFQEVHKIILKLPDPTDVLPYIQPGFSPDYYEALFGELKFRMYKIFEYAKQSTEILHEFALGSSSLRQRSQISLPLLPKRFPICEGNEPSPININTTSAIASSLKPYKFGENFDRLYKIRMFFEDDGTTLLQVIFEDADRLLGRSISMNGGPVKGTELFFEIMLIKFGNDKNSGSEHRINGKTYGMELQFIFSNKGTTPKHPYYHTLARTLNDLFPYREKLVIILSVLVEVVPKEKATNPLLFEGLAQAAYKFREQRERYPNGQYDEIYRAFRTDNYVMRLSDFIPTKSPFYTYRGSLSFPPCFNYLLWSVFETPLQITEEQFTEFTLMPAVGRDDTNHVAGNIRTIEDEWVREENTPGILPADQANLRKTRQERTVLRSLNISDAETGDEQYDYFYDYDNALKNVPSLVFITVVVVINNLI